MPDQAFLFIFLSEAVSTMYANEFILYVAMCKWSSHYYQVFHLVFIQIYHYVFELHFVLINIDVTNTYAQLHL